VVVCGVLEVFNVVDGETDGTGGGVEGGVQGGVVGGVQGGVVGGVQGGGGGGGGKSKISTTFEYPLILLFQPPPKNILF
jgi:hypothetical protein